MMDDLFGSANTKLILPLSGADLAYFPSIVLDEPAEDIVARLQNSIAWRAEEITVWGKKFLQPRLIAWYGEPDLGYSYSGIELKPLPWTEDLLKFKHIAESLSGYIFNSVLLNYYRDHRDSMGFHSDNESELGANPVIASLSLGQERTLIFKHKSDKLLRPYRIRLQSGSLLVMKGETQRNWLHGIEKSTRECGPRINMTFRRIFSTI